MTNRTPSFELFMHLECLRRLGPSPRTPPTFDRAAAEQSAQRLTETTGSRHVATVEWNIVGTEPLEVEARGWQSVRWPN